MGGGIRRYCVEIARSFRSLCVFPPVLQAARALLRARVGFLLGDVNQNRVVTLSDLGQVNAQVAQFVTAANFLKDVNVSGTLSLADKGIVNIQITKALPPP